MGRKSLSTSRTNPITSPGSTLSLRLLAFIFRNSIRRSTSRDSLRVPRMAVATAERGGAIGFPV